MKLEGYVQASFSSTPAQSKVPISFREDKICFMTEDYSLWPLLELPRNLWSIVNCKNSISNDSIQDLYGFISTVLLGGWSYLELFYPFSVFPFDFARYRGKSASF